MSAVEFVIRDGMLLLRYEPQDGPSWVHKRFGANQTLAIKGTYFFTREHLVETPIDVSEDDDHFEEQAALYFRVAIRESEYFRVDGLILNLNVELLIHQDVELTWKSFTVAPKISVFRAIARLKPGRIVIGGSEPDSIPEASFNGLIERFPSGFELHRYAMARVSAVIRDYVETEIDAESLFKRYVDKRAGKAVRAVPLDIKENELQKYRFLHDRLVHMLAAEDAYSESAWQTEILQIILLLNPKYIQALREAIVRDTFKKVNRRIDILLVDASGHVDIVEIKQPFDKCVITNTLYRDNYIPLRELSGTVMQVEKYLFYLNRWGQAGEEKLTETYKKVLPDGFSIKITNPSGIIIMGRDANLNDAQKQDFEVVKRKYKNMLDIITYDDLLRRLDFIVKQLEADI